MLKYFCVEVKIFALATCRRVKCNANRTRECNLLQQVQLVNAARLTDKSAPSANPFNTKWRHFKAVELDTVVTNYIIPFLITDDYFRNENPKSVCISFASARSSSFLVAPHILMLIRYSNFHNKLFQTTQTTCPHFYYDALLMPKTACTIVFS